MHILTYRHGIYFSGTVSQLRAFLRNATPSDMLLSAWIKKQLH